ncbi:MAG: hypothetical protein K2X03_26275 [Bryobacteraceae bacterium]|nr:hypothetical protein [Bryobacteraceae bacterium]
MTLGLVAADPYELAPYASRLAACESLRRAPALGRTQSGDTVRLAAFGPGFRAARRAAEAILAAGPIDLLISTGTCGALDPSLALGDIVVDPRGQQPRTALAFRSGLIVSQDRVASTAAEKQSLSQQGLAVEMESAAVRDVAGRHQLPFACIKAVSDSAGQSLPLDFNLYRAPAGHFRKAHIVAAMLARPFARIPAILELRAQAQLAARALGGFLADCRF